MQTETLPDNFALIHQHEEKLRKDAITLLHDSGDLMRHVAIVEKAMDLADLFRQLPTTNENLKVIQILGMRTFNAFAASLKLALSGYSQNSALILRDILEAVYLLDLFDGDQSQVERWREASEQDRKRQFMPVHVREKLDHRDGITSMARKKRYERFSRLAGHPSMAGIEMMRPKKGGDAVIGPFLDHLGPVLEEMGRLGTEVGTFLDVFLPQSAVHAMAAQIAFRNAKQEWLATFKVVD